MLEHKIAEDETAARKLEPTAMIACVAAMMWQVWCSKLYVWVLEAAFAIVAAIPLHCRQVLFLNVLFLVLC